MAKPNYAFAKRQKEIAKKQKQEEKQRLKAAANQPPLAQEENKLPVVEEKAID